MILGLIPAAGKSTRMGRPKLSLRLGPRTVLEHVIAALWEGGVDQVLVVVGPAAAELLPLAESAGAQTLLLPRDTPDMRTTVEAGLRWSEEHFQPQPADGWILVPADHPTLQASVIRRLLQAKLDRPQSSIVIPCFEGRRGHPALMEWKHAAGLRGHPAGEGINLYLRGHAAQTYLLDVAEPAILHDLDTPEDFERLQREWGKSC